MHSNEKFHLTTAGFDLFDIATLQKRFRSILRQGICYQRSKSKQSDIKSRYTIRELIYRLHSLYSKYIFLRTSHTNICAANWLRRWITFRDGRPAREAANIFDKISSWKNPLSFSKYVGTICCEWPIQVLWFEKVILFTFSWMINTMRTTSNNIVLWSAKKRGLWEDVQI